MADVLRGRSWAELKEAVARGEIRFPTSEELRADLMIANNIYDRVLQFEERRIRECLGRWVSELEPQLIYQNHRFIGLGLRGDLSEYPKIYVKAPDHRYIQWSTADADRRDDRSLAVAYSFETYADFSAGRSKP